MRDTTLSWVGKQVGSENMKYIESDERHNQIPAQPNKKTR